MKKTFLAILAICMILSIIGCSEKEEKSSSETDLQDTSVSTASKNEKSVDEIKISPKIDDDFIKDVVINFGAVETTNEQGESCLKEQEISLFCSDTWTQDTMEVGDFFSWYMGYMWREDLTYEEKCLKYKNPLGEDMGWFFPADIYEPIVMKYFNTTEEFLRSDPIYYNQEYNGYTVGGSGGIGNRPVITIDKWEQENNIINIYLSLFVENCENRNMVLTVELTDEGYNLFLI